MSRSRCSVAALLRPPSKGRSHAHRARNISRMVFPFVLVVMVAACGSSNRSENARPEATERPPLCDYNATNEDALPLTKGPADGAVTTTLFDNPVDRCAQLKGLIEDTKRVPGATDDSDMVRYSENGEFMESICKLGSGTDPGPLHEVLCDAPRGYIMAVNTTLSTDPPIPDARQQKILEIVGQKWRKVYRHYHPNNPHCALAIIDDDEQNAAKDESPINDDDHGHQIVAMKCF